MSDDQHKKPETPAQPGASSGSPDRPAAAPATLGGLADLVKAAGGNAGSTPGAVSLGGLADLVKATPPADAPVPAAPAPASPFDQKVGSAASQYTFVMNSSDLKDLIGDPNKQRVSVHSASSAGFESSPRTAHSEPPPKPATRDLPEPPSSPGENPAARAPSRTGSRAPMVKVRPERSNTTRILLAIAILLLFIFLLMRRNAALEVEARAPEAAPEAVPTTLEPAPSEE